LAQLTQTAAAMDYESKADSSTLDRRGTEAAALFVTAERHFNDWELDEALKAASDALELYRQQGDRTRVADALSLVIRSLGSQERLQEAEDMVTTELKRFRSAGDAMGEAKMLLLRAEMCYHREDQQEEALRLAREAQQLFEHEDDSLGQARAFMLMAESNMACGKCKAAAHPAQKASRLFRKAGDEHEGVRAMLLASQADIAILAKGARESTYTAWEEALRRANQGVHNARATKDQALVASALCQVAEVHNSTGSYEEALQASEEAAKLYDELGNPQEVASALHWSADTYIKAEKYTEALKVAEDIRRLAHQHGDSSIEELAQEIVEAATLDPQPDSYAAGNDGSPPKEKEQKEEQADWQGPSYLVKNQQGEVMDLHSGLTLAAVRMNPSDIADVMKRVLANYTAEEFDNEAPLMQAGLTGAMSVALQSEWHRKHMSSNDQDSLP